MSAFTCSYQLIAPGEAPPAAAPVHPDPAIEAGMATAARAGRPRRFVFCKQLAGRTGPEWLVQGFVNPNGSVVLLGKGGHPFGWYTSVDTAFAHLPDTSNVYLVWQEPDLPKAELLRDAQHEAQQHNGEPELWYLAIPFLAHGANDARVHAIGVADCLEEPLPGLYRDGMSLVNGDSPGTGMIAVYCPSDGCARAPFHHGNHDPNPDVIPPPEEEESAVEAAPEAEPVPAAETEPEAAPEPEPDAEAPQAEPGSEPVVPEQVKVKPKAVKRSQPAKETATGEGLL